MLMKYIVSSLEKYINKLSHKLYKGDRNRIPAIHSIKRRVKQMSNNRPKVGIGVFVIREGKFLLGERQGAHGENTWSLPGGHLEFKEEWDDCAAREVKEETGMEIDNVRFLSVTNDIFEEEDKHYITIFLTSDWVANEPQLKEPKKCKKWEWFTFYNLPSPLFLPMQNLLKRREKINHISEL